MRNDFVKCIKRILLPVFAMLFSLLVLPGCSAKPYSFEEPIDTIEYIKIVTAESSLKFSVLKTLSENEKHDFLEQFQDIPFYTYYLGDPMSVYGTAAMICYSSGNYEMVSYSWSEYVKDGQIYFIRKSCEEEVFHSLLDQYFMQPL